VGSFPNVGTISSWFTEQIVTPPQPLLGCPGWMIAMRPSGV